MLKCPNDGIELIQIGQAGEDIQKCPSCNLKSTLLLVEYDALAKERTWARRFDKNYRQKKIYKKRYHRI